ncbi:MAG: sugar phosphate isomerase/epimerase [Planctomycetota bacterium]|nr:MAG: sugar phosphate isomerase/epimerase [Planctomycetota bacterium]REJ92828.1 MAG: sugar phosphate isomerase/epimerase [Planctomycetota bacterium]
MLNTAFPAGAPASLHRAAPATDLANRLSISQTTTLRWTLPDAVDEYPREGIAGIAVSWESLRSYGLEPGVRLLRRSPLTVTSLGWVGGFTGDHGYTYDDAVAEARQAVMVAAEVGAHALTVVSGTQGGHIRPHARRLLIDALQELAPLAAERKVRLALQPMHPLYENEWTFLVDLDQTLGVLDELDHPYVGMACGLYHLWQQPRFVERIPEFAHRIASVQVSDWREPARCDNDRVLPGDGTIPLEGIINALEEAGYSGFYEIEVWSRDLWSRDQHDLIRQCRQRYLDLVAAVA